MNEPFSQYTLLSTYLNKQSREKLGKNNIKAYFPVLVVGTIKPAIMIFIIISLYRKIIIIYIIFLHNKNNKNHDSYFYCAYH